MCVGKRAGFPSARRRAPSPLPPPPPAAPRKRPPVLQIYRFGVSRDAEKKKRGCVRVWRGRSLSAQRETRGGSRALSPHSSSPQPRLWAAPSPATTAALLHTCTLLAARVSHTHTHTHTHTQDTHPRHPLSPPNACRHFARAARARGRGRPVLGRARPGRPGSGGPRPWDGRVGGVRGVAGRGGECAVGERVCVWWGCMPRARCALLRAAALVPAPRTRVGAWW